MNSTRKYRLLRHPHVYTAMRRGLLVGRYLTRRPHEDDFRAFAELSGDGLFLDVGANSGASALAFRIYNRRSPILCVEPSVGHAFDLGLVRRLAGKTDILFAAAGSEPGVMDLHMPYYYGLPISQFASLHEQEVAEGSWNIRQLLSSPGIDRSKFELRVEKAPVVRLDDLDLAPSFVKIDVQGHELAVLKGLEQTLIRHSPALLIEVGKDLDAPEWLIERGYVPHALFDRDVLRAIHDLTAWQHSESRRSPNLFMLPEGGHHGAEQEHATSGRSAGA